MRDQRPRARPVLTGLLTIVLFSSGTAQAQASASDLKALGTVYSVGVLGSFMRDWCVTRAPQTKATIEAGYAGWLADTKLATINKVAAAQFGDALGGVRSSLESGRQQMYAQLDQNSKNPAQECQGIRTYLNNGLNPQKLYPNEYAAALNTDFAVWTRIRCSPGCVGMERNPYLLLLTPFGFHPPNWGMGSQSV